MRQEIAETPDETPIVYVLIVLGLLSYLAAFPVSGLRDGSLVLFNVTTIAGFICGLIALPLGLKLGNLRLNEARVPISSISP